MGLIWESFEPTFNFYNYNGNRMQIMHFITTRVRD